MNPPVAEAKGQPPAEGVTVDNTIDPNATPGDTSNGTPEGNETPNPEQQSDPNDEMRYSERTLTAAKEVAITEARAALTKERADAERERSTRLAAQVRDTRAGPAPVIRGVQDALKTLADDLTPDEMEPVVKVIREARATIEQSSFVIVAEAYKDSIDAALGSPEKASEFWTAAEGLDPSLDVSVVLPLFAEQVALDTDAVRTAKPEDLIAKNPALKLHIETYGDTRWKEGRGQGQTDPKGEVIVDGKPVNNTIAPASVKGRTPEQIAEDLRDPTRRAALGAALQTATRR